MAAWSDSKATLVAVGKFIGVVTLQMIALILASGSLSTANVFWAAVISATIVGQAYVFIAFGQS